MLLQVIRTSDVGIKTSFIRPYLEAGGQNEAKLFRIKLVSYEQNAFKKSLLSGLFKREVRVSTYWTMLSLNFLNSNFLNSNGRKISQNINVEQSSEENSKLQKYVHNARVHIRVKMGLWQDRQLYRGAPCSLIRNSRDNIRTTL